MKIKKLVRLVSVMATATVMAMSLVACGSSNQTSTSGQNGTNSSSNSGKIVMVWYPNESASDYQAARDEFAKLITQATGKEVEQKLTTDYSIAIESVANGTAQICFMGAQGYIEAKNKNNAVMPLFVNSGTTGTLDDAKYYSWIAVNTANASIYSNNGTYSIDNIQGKKMSFVSNSSTSGFKVPTSGIISHFSTTQKWAKLSVDDLISGDSNGFFSEVLFGGSHQGSAVNLLTGKADVAAFCDTELAPYAKLSSGTDNKTGAVYEIKSGANAPFDTLVGKQFTVIQSTPVLNGPFAYNSSTLSSEDVKKIQALFTSDEVANNPQIFVSKDTGLVGMFKKTSKERIVLVDDSWFNPIRELSK